DHSKKSSLAEVTYRFKDENDINWALDYMLARKLNRFIWLESRLSPEGRHHQWLECYGRNSFMTLVRAWNCEGILALSANVKKKTASLQELYEAAYSHLDSPAFQNASLRSFLQRTDVQKTIGAAANSK